MKNYIHFICIASIVILFSSCKILNPRFFNSPSTEAPAYLEKKGDSKISAGFSFFPESEYDTFDSSFPLIFAPTGTRKSKTYGFNASAAYAFSNRFMATLGGAYQKERDLFSSNDILQTYSSSRIDYTRKVLDVGAGMIIPIDSRSRFVFNPIIGVNIGRFESYFKNTSDTVSNNNVYHFHDNFGKLYIKPNFNFHFHKNIKMNVVPQLSLMKLGNIDDNYPETVREGFNFNKIQKTYIFLFEPATFLQIGFYKIEWLKLDLGMTFSIYCPANEDLSSRLRTRNVQLSAGFSIYP